MDKLNLPESLSEMLYGFTFAENSIGRSNSVVYRCEKGNTVYYLKTGSDLDIFREHNILKWLQDKLPVPEILYFGTQDNTFYILMTEMQGTMSYEIPKDLTEQEHYKNAAGLLADGIKMLWDIDISECPFQRSTDHQLDRALYNIENGIVDLEDFEHNEYESPMHLYHYLSDNKLPEELAFVHGDYCLPNIFFKENNISGFIDLGRAGVSDKWMDVALCVRSLKYNFGEKYANEYIDIFFNRLGIVPNWDKINFHILMDELF